ncbi:MAG: ferritin-like domain-containing protein [Litoreibacter sp.]|uniref:ferritin-like domain-containing protein n=1 Tax=Litoreibacter sp. TaxID=1969459 RepID=UPI00329756A1
MSLRDMSMEVLSTADPLKKTALSREFAKIWRDARKEGQVIDLGQASPPDYPARPPQPELLAPRDVPSRKPGTAEGRTAMLHAIAHIELNAVDLHWDIIARFADIDFPLGFYDDWVQAADDESKHFNLMEDCLKQRDSFYGALPAHAGMWASAVDTASDIMGRLAVVPMVLEARGLDVTPSMLALFKQAKDTAAVDALEVIYSEEVAHVAYGSKWFHFLCGRRNLDPTPTFHALVREYFHGQLRPPFNEEKRAEAGIAPDFYWPLVDQAKR